MDFLVSIPYIVLLLGGLIFFHELGHFVFARWMGVHVITFSIGFGPVLFRLRGRKRGDMPPTEYVISALPFGGFVRMLGADPTEVVDERLRHHAFESKAVWRRFLIMAAGPAFNLMLPYFIYIGLGLSTTEHLPSFVGTVSHDSPAAAAGLQSGDTITAIDGEPVQYWWQIHKAISEGPGVTLAVDVRGSDDATRSLEVVPELVRHVHVPEVLVDEVGRIGITPDYLKPAIAVIPASPAFEAGLRSGDIVQSVNGQSIRTLNTLFSLLDSMPNAPLEIVATRTQPASRPASTPQSMWVEEKVIASISATSQVPARGIASLDCALRAVEPGTPAHAMGLEAGDVLLSLDGVRCRLFGFLMSRLRADPEASHVLVWSHGAAVRTATASSWLGVPPAKPGDDTQLKAPIFGVATWNGLRESPSPIPNEHTWTYAVTHAIDATHRAMWMNVAAVAGLFRGRVPVQELSGPVGIAKLAAETTERGWSYFFGLMVWLSVSLGILNLLPIPVLDGGHIMFLAIEAVQRRPVSMRTRQVATYAGLAFIILLMVLVLKFDIERVMG